VVSVTIRNLTETSHRALKMRAASNQRSLETEIREILKDAVSPARRVKGANPSPYKLKISSELAAFGRRFGGIDLRND
jgi:antitoxin FitA